MKVPKQTQTLRNDHSDQRHGRANRSSDVEYRTANGRRELRNPQPIAGPIYVPSAAANKSWPHVPEGYEYRFCLPSSPVLHFLRELTTGVLISFRIQRGEFIKSGALAGWDDANTV
jgi:hypothetical protein